MTLLYAIKYGDISFFCYVIRKMIIIFQPPAIYKPKYSKIILKQFHILNTKAVNLLLQKAHLTNALVNSLKLLYIFYKIDLLLKYQKKKFK